MNKKIIQELFDKNVMGKTFIIKGKHDGEIGHAVEECMGYLEIIKMNQIFWGMN